MYCFIEEISQRVDGLLLEKERDELLCHHTRSSFKRHASLMYWDYPLNDGSPFIQSLDLYHLILCMF